MGSSPRGCRVGHDLRTKEQRRSRGVWERQASTQAVASMTTVLGLETAPHRGLVLSAAPGAREPGGGCPPCSAGWEQRPRRGPLWPRWGPGTGAGSSAAIPAPWKDAELDATQGPGRLCACLRVQQRPASGPVRRGTRTGEPTQAALERLRRAVCPPASLLPAAAGLTAGRGLAGPGFLAWGKLRADG